MKIPKRKEKKLKNTRNENIAIINFAIKILGRIKHDLKIHIKFYILSSCNDALFTS